MVGGASYNSNSRKQEPLYVYLGIRKGTPSDLRRECLFLVDEKTSLVNEKTSLVNKLTRYE